MAEPIADCAGCGTPILGGEGVTVSADGRRWHPQCRANDLAGDKPAKTPRKGQQRTAAHQGAART